MGFLRLLWVAISLSRVPRHPSNNRSTVLVAVGRLRGGEMSAHWLTVNQSIFALSFQNGGRSDVQWAAFLDAGRAGLLCEWTPPADPPAVCPGPLQTFLRLWHLRNPRLWHVRILRLWHIGVLRRWKNRILRPWHIRILRQWHIRNLRL